MSRLAYAAGRIAAGSRACAGRLAAWAAAWCRRAYRDDLTGWRARLGPIVRAVILAGAAATAGLVVRARPWLMWVLTTGWLIAAWRASRPAPGEDIEDEPEEEAEQPDPAAAEEAFRQLLRDAIGDRNGVLLRDVLALLHEVGMHPDWEVSDVWSACERVGVRPRRAVKVGGEGGYGVLRGDLPAPSEAPSPTAAEAASPTRSTAA